MYSSCALNTRLLPPYGGIETGGSGGSMNRGPELLGVRAPSAGQKIFTQEKNMPLGVGGLHRFPDPVYSRPSHPKAPPQLSALRAFSFIPWGPAKGTEGPQVTVEPGPLKALLRHCPRTRSNTRKPQHRQTKHNNKPIVYSRLHPCYHGSSNKLDITQAILQLDLISYSTDSDGT